ncbi:MAG: PhzF family phenazine biosynthesis protein [Candidatus Scalindua sp. AMX11]|nr:MAG: PhzF family phenazine biosynthesis protein [Candidatus Scalindua sp.]NOG83603.1 PhzF family phenazine biosynthesis protein [Planctomycetota bacterium]RZV69645.1 MAG: PhzF family phenazine biosynthesis protein [Candidatus Scalindua sp. SCAELEC01]TDE64090.1 MAG: PhzF family phenazine biosynthesis protein [Candidatus Scalindua sp. AMX11]GJQ60164.1 MAG: putative isomerase [Candidatus Scalindua sp.]
MEIALYQIDAFASEVFKGNPAAVCPLEGWLPDSLLQKIAAENNLSETAFYVPTASGFHLRWFAPTSEVDLCGHATLATAFVIFHIVGYELPAIRFQTRSGELVVERDGESIIMDFPTRPVKDCSLPGDLSAGLRREPIHVFSSDDYIAVFDNEDDIVSLDPDYEMLRKLDLRGVVVTSRGESADFVSRFFAPKLGVNEDPVTGSSHCELVPYWADRLRKTKLRAKQLSKRGGEIGCELRGNRVLLSGRAVKYMEGRITCG